MRETCCILRPFTLIQNLITWEYYKNVNVLWYLSWITLFLQYLRDTVLSIHESQVLHGWKDINLWSQTYSAFKYSYSMKFEVIHSRALV